jgi:hypothetical protein
MAPGYSASEATSGVVIGCGFSGVLGAGTFSKPRPSHRSADALVLQVLEQVIDVLRSKRVRRFVGMLAGASGRSVVVREGGRWASARGAGLVAARAVGAIDADAATSPRGRTIEPAAGAAAMWEDLDHRHDRLLARFRQRAAEESRRTYARERQAHPRPSPVGQGSHLREWLSPVLRPSRTSTLDEPEPCVRLHSPTGRTSEAGRRWTLAPPV